MENNKKSMKSYQQSRFPPYSNRAGHQRQAMKVLLKILNHPPLMILCIFLGLLPYTYPSLTKSSVIISLLTITSFITASMTLNIVYNLNSLNSWDFTNRLTLPASRILQYCPVILHIIVLLMNSKKYSVFLRLIHAHPISRSSTFFTVFFAILLCATYTALSAVRNERYLAIANFFNVIELMSDVMIFLLFYTCLNQILIELKEKTRFLMEEENLDLLTTALEVEGLVRRAVFVNGVFSKQLLCGFAHYCFTIVRSGRNVYNFCVTNQTFFAFGFTILIFYSLLMFFIVCRICELNSKEVEEFHSILFKKIYFNKKFRLDKKLRFYIMTRPKLIFSASGFFEIGNHLMSSMISACATFLIILIQFSPT